MSIKEKEQVQTALRIAYYSGLFFMAVYAFQLTGEL
jgi:hypothetical protein